MPYYIKVRKRVAEAAGLADKRLRLRLADGCYMLWQNDLLAVAPDRPLWEMDGTCALIGALKLTPTEARAEQDCRDAALCRPLPEPADGKWADQEPEAEAEAAGEDAEPLNAEEP